MVNIKNIDYNMKGNIDYNINLYIKVVYMKIISKEKKMKIPKIYLILMI